MKQSHNEKGEYVRLCPTHDIPDDVEIDALKIEEWIVEIEKQGMLCIGNHGGCIVFWEPEKQ